MTKFVAQFDILTFFSNCKINSLIMDKGIKDDFLQVNSNFLKLPILCST